MQQIPRKTAVWLTGLLFLTSLLLLPPRVFERFRAQAAALADDPQGAPERRARGWEDEAERREEREREFLKTLTDANGRLRPDLWRRGIAHAEQMKIGAQVRLSGPKNKLAGPILGVQWKQIGPAPLRIDNEQNFQGAGPDSGEVVDLAIDPRNTTDRVIYIATNDGGIWKTTDGGVTWRPKTDFLPSLSMGAVALDPANPSIVYAGTGNPFDGGGIFSKGVGIYKSIDAGETWTTVGAGVFTNRALVRIRMPAANVLLVATNNGLFRSADGGLNWGNNAPNFNNGASVLNGFISDLQLDTAAPTTTVLAAVNGQGIFRSTDAGVTFPTNLFTATNGAPTANVAFISFAQSTAPNNQTIYASVQDARAQTTPPRPSPFPFLGLYKSTDGGANWTRMAGADSAGNGCQCGYDQTVGVDPQDAQRVYIGFQRLWSSGDGGGSFNAVSDNKIHWDHHAIYFSPASHFTGGAPTRVWVGTDGGVHSSTDAGANWQNLNEGIGTNLFFSLDIGRGSAANNVYSYGGCQDTGTVEHAPGHPGTDWHLGVDGDGGRIAVDPCNPMHAIGTDNGGFIQTSNGGANWSGGGGFPANTSIGIVRFDPNCNIAYAGAVTTDPMTMARTFRLFRSTDNAANFAPVRTFTAGITAVAQAAIDSNTVWVALGDGTLQVTANAGAGAAATWTTVNVTGAPGGAATALAVDPNNTARVVAVYGGFTNFTANRTRHVFLTNDNGATWANISGTAGAPLVQNLPDLPVRDVVIDPNTNPHTIIVANDAGVMRTVDNGASWERYGVGLPTVLSTALAIDSNAMPAVLRVGTYGRSVFELSTAENPLLAVNANLAFEPVCKGAGTSRVVQVFNVGAQDLHISSFFRSSGSTDFQIVSGPTTPVTLKPGEEVDFTIGYTPSGTADQTAEFQINSDDPFQPVRKLTASASGAAPQLNWLIADSGEFGTVCAGSFKDLDLTLNNTGQCPLVVNSLSVSPATDFQVAGTLSFPLVVAPGDALEIPIRFRPTTPGSKTATVRITSNGATGTTEIAVSGTGGQPTIATVIADNGNFGDVCVGSFKDLPLVVNNKGTCPLRLTGLSSSSPEFQTAGVMSFPLVIAPGDSLTIPIRFQPASYGMKTATITLSSDDPANPSKGVSVSGNVPSATIVAPDMLDFGKVCPGDTRNLTLTIGNSGGCDLIVKSITSDSPEFKVVGVVPFPFIVPPGQTRDVQIQFMPMGFTVNPVHMATLTIMSNDLVTPNKTVIVKGTVPPPVIQVSPDPLDFGKVCLGTFKDLPLTIKNAGECKLTISGITSDTADFSVAPGVSFPLMVPPGGMINVPIRFKPLSTGPKMGMLTINSDDPVTPAKKVTVKGLAPVSQIAVSGDFSFGKVPVGKFKDQYLNVTNTEPCDLLITLICEVTENGITTPSSEFNVVSPVAYPILIPGGGTLPVQIRFKPLRTGPRRAKLLVFGFDPQTAALMLTVEYELTGQGQ